MKTYLVDIKTLHRRPASRVLDFINFFFYNEYLLLKKTKICDNSLRNFTPGREVIRIHKKYESVKMGCFRTWHLSGVKKNKIIPRPQYRILVPLT